MPAFAISAYSQVNATATASANIIAPVTITKDADLHFGTVIKGPAGGTVVLTPLNVRSVTGDVTLSALAPVPAPASFTVGGEATFTYSISVAGATLNVGANQPSGAYTSGPFTVTVNYN